MSNIFTVSNTYFFLFLSSLKKEIIKKLIVENDSHNLIIKSIEMSNTSSPDFSELSRHITKTIVKTQKKKSRYLLYST